MSEYASLIWMASMIVKIVAFAAPVAVIVWILRRKK